MATFKVRLREEDKIVDRVVEADVMSPGDNWLTFYAFEGGGRRTTVAAFKSDEVVSAEKA